MKKNEFQLPEILTVKQLAEYIFKWMNILFIGWLVQRLTQLNWVNLFS